MSTIFPSWTNSVPRVLGGGLATTLVAVVALVWHYFTPEYWEVGYQPQQPVAFSHQIHAGQLGMDCRYCHTHVYDSKHANIPSSNVCMNCHTVVDELNGYLKKAVTVDGVSASAHWENEALQTLRAYHGSGDPVPWRRIHKVPDYAHFNHAVHLNAGVSCYSCHQRIDQMPVVSQAESLSMGWCLECHRAPEQHLVDPSEIRLTDLRSVEAALTDPNHASSMGSRIADRLRRNPPQACGACHY